MMLAMFLPLVSLAATIETFQSIPFLEGKSLSTESYVNALYRASIAIAALLVVLRLILAGVKYIFSEIITNKQEAKKEIMGSLLGLLVILAAVTLLQTINPNLVKLDFLRNAQPVTISSHPSQASEANGVEFGVGDSVTRSQITTGEIYKEYVNSCAKAGGVFNRSFLGGTYYCEKR